MTLGPVVKPGPPPTTEGPPEEWRPIEGRKHWYESIKADADGVRRKRYDPPMPKPARPAVRPWTPPYTSHEPEHETPEFDE